MRQLFLRFLCKMFIAATLICVAEEHARAQWHRADTQHFTIYFDGSAAQLSQYASKLEKFDLAVRLARGVPDFLPAPANKLTIYAVKDLKQIEELYGGQGAAGFYIPRAGRNVAFVPIETYAATRLDLSADAVFFHEYTHHLFYETLDAALPLWVTEGLAEFFSTAKFERDGGVGLGAPATHRADILTANLYAPLPLEVMLEGNAERLKKYYLEEVYGRGWLLIHYLTFNAARRGQLEKYAASIQRGVPALEAARAAFGPIAKLEGELRDYVRSVRFPYVVVAASKISTGPIRIAKLRPSAAAFMQIRMKAERAKNAEQAQEVVDAGRSIAARYPDDLEVQTWLAELELTAEHYDEALSAAKKALAGDPQSLPALVAKARASIVVASKSKTPEAIAEARRLLLEANRRDPEHPIPLIAYYGSFSSPPKDALDGLLYAFSLAPSDDDLRWETMRALVAHDRLSEPAKILKPLAYAPHGGKSTERAQKVLGTIESGDLQSAIKAIQAVEEEEKSELPKKRRG